MQDKTIKMNTNHLLDRSKQSREMSVTVREPGLVHIHYALEMKEQCDLANRLLQCGHDADSGFWEESTNGERVLNSTKTRGRMYRSVDQYGPELHSIFVEKGRTVHEMACAVDSAMPEYKKSTHALVLYYAVNRGLGEHRDSGANDGSSDQPVISFNLGKAVDFTVRHTKEEPKKMIRLNSGDAILFGGPCRMILHGVHKIHPDTNPLVEHGIEDVRLNLTLRYAPEILGKESEYKIFKPVRGTASKKLENEAA